MALHWECWKENSQGLWMNEASYMLQAGWKKFQSGYEVYLKLQPYRWMSMEARSNLKLVSKYINPYKVLEMIGMVPYKLDPPKGGNTYPTFHVS